MNAIDEHVTRHASVLDRHARTERGRPTRTLHRRSCSAWPRRLPDSHPSLWRNRGRCRSRRVAQPPSCLPETFRRDATAVTALHRRCCFRSAAPPPYEAHASQRGCERETSLRESSVVGILARRRVQHERGRGAPTLRTLRVHVRALRLRREGSFTRNAFCLPAGPPGGARSTTQDSGGTWQTLLSSR